MQPTSFQNLISSVSPNYIKISAYTKKDDNLDFIFLLNSSISDTESRYTIFKDCILRGDRRFKDPRKMVTYGNLLGIEAIGYLKEYRRINTFSIPIVQYNPNHGFISDYAYTAFSKCEKRLIRLMIAKKYSDIEYEFQRIRFKENNPSTLFFELKMRNVSTNNTFALQLSIQIDASINSIRIGIIFDDIHKHPNHFIVETSYNDEASDMLLKVFHVLIFSIELGLVRLVL